MENAKDYAVDLLDTMCEYGFEKVLNDFERDAYSDWISSLIKTADIVCGEWEGYDGYILVAPQKDIHIAAGASKMVFWTDESDLVFKIGFENCIYDYCKDEADIYELAVEENLQKFFAKTSYLMDYCAQAVYVAERADVSYYHLSDDLSDKLKSDGYSKAEIEETIEQAESCNEFFETIIPYYEDRDTVNELFYFLSSHHVNDLHSGNIGYINNRPVLIDYSGYHG